MSALRRRLLRISIAKASKRGGGGKPQNYGPGGRYASAGGVLASARNRRKEIRTGNKKLAQKLYTELTTNEGFTMDAATQRPRKSGYSVGTKPSSPFAFKSPVGKLTSESINQWLRDPDVSRALAVPGRKAGGWVSEDTDESSPTFGQKVAYIDVVRVFDRSPNNRVLADKLGRKKDQIEVADLDEIQRALKDGNWANTTWSTGGTGIPKPGRKPAAGNYNEQGMEQRASLRKQMWGYMRPGTKKCEHCNGQGTMPDATGCDKCGATGLVKKNMPAPDPQQARVADALRQTLSDVVVMYFHAHGYHWNVKGPDFAQYHALFAEIYEDVYGSVDPLAENILKLGGTAPARLSDYLAASSLNDSAAITTDPLALARDLAGDNDAVLASLKRAFDIANAANEQGIANFIAERIDSHQKWGWQLKSSDSVTKGDEEVPVWETPNPKKKHNKMSKKEIAMARARAEKAGRPYPNLIDNMAVSKYSPEEKRDESGKWTAGGSASKGKSPSDKSMDRHWAKKVDRRQLTDEQNERYSSAELWGVDSHAALMRYALGTHTAADKKKYEYSELEKSYEDRRSDLRKSLLD